MMKKRYGKHLLILTELLDANYRIARHWRTVALTGMQYGNARQVREGIRGLIAVADDTIRLLRSSWGRNPDTPDEMMEDLRLSFLIDGALIELLMKDWPGISRRDEERLLARARKLTAVLRRKAAQARDIIRRVWPEYYTSTIRRELDRMVKAKP